MKRARRSDDIQSGRDWFRREQGAHLKAGVKKTKAKMTPQEMRRKGSWAVRFYGRTKLPPLVDAKGRPSYVTSAGSGPSVGRHLLMAYLPAAEAVEGNALLVEYMGEQYPVTVARASATPLFDPENARIRS